MKGFIGEMLTFVIIIISIMILVFFFTNERVTKGGEVEKSIMVKEIKNTCISTLNTIANTKVERIGKTYLEVALDSCYNPQNTTYVYYGDGLGTVMVNEILSKFIDNLIGKGHWKLIINNGVDICTYGDLEINKTLVKCYLDIPLSEIESNPIGKVILYVG